MILFHLALRDQRGTPLQWSHHGGDSAVNLWEDSHESPLLWGDTSFHTAPGLGRRSSHSDRACTSFLVMGGEPTNVSYT